MRARRDLIGHRVAAANQLRAHLQIVSPTTATLFAEVDPEITLAFLSRFTTQEQAGWPSPKRLAAWLKSVSYSGGTDPAVLHARLLAAPGGQAGPHAAALAGVTLALVAVLRTLTTQIQAMAASTGTQLNAHPDAVIFQSLPRSGVVRAARLLAEIGDARGRFPTRESLTCLAGVAPSTRQSGKVKAVTFRWGADKQLRDALCDFAADSRRARPGPPAATTKPSPAAATTPTPSASSPAPGPRHLALLARPHPLRPGRPQQPPSTPQPRSAERGRAKGLTQGNS